MAQATLAEANEGLFDSVREGTTKPRSLRAELAGKANIEHTHVIDDVDGLQDALDSKADA